MSSNPSFIFFGTPEFSAQFLAALIDHGFIPKAVVTNPDRPLGRKKIITPPPVKTATEACSAKTGTTIPVFQPQKIDAAFQESLRSFAADFFVVFAYNKIFKKSTLDIPRGGTIGVHPSFLPAYRGPSPFQTAILDGATETGVTLYFLDEGIDSGPIIAVSEPVAITDEDTFGTLAKKLAAVGANLFIKTFPEIVTAARDGVTIAAHGSHATQAAHAQPQDENRATYTKKFKTEDGFVDPADLVAASAITGNGDQSGVANLAKKILRKIHAFDPEPGAWTLQDGKRVKLLTAKMDGGGLVLTTTQKEGEKPKAS